MEASMVAHASSQDVSPAGEADLFFDAVRETRSTADTIACEPPVGAAVAAHDQLSGGWEPEVEGNEEGEREQRVQKSLEIFYEQRSNREVDCTKHESGGVGQFASMLDDAREEAEAD